MNNFGGSTPKSNQRPRDTQFSGFAKMLFDELQAIEVEGLKNSWNNLDVYRRQREAIARRAYDLVDFALANVVITYVSGIPDMTEWPDWTEDEEQQA